MKKTVLAVFTPHIGNASETFIRRHIEGLAPGRTVVVARYAKPPFGSFWNISCPVFYLDEWTRRLGVRLARRAGASESWLRDRAVTRFLKSHGVAVALGEYLDQFADFVPLLDRMGLPYVVQGHGIDLSAALREPNAAGRYQRYRSARAVLTRSEYHRRRLLGLGLDEARVEANPGGVDVPDAPPAREPAALKRFLAIGRMIPKKGPIYLLESFRIAAAADPALRLDYIGDGALMPAAAQFLGSCNLADRVRLHGAVTESEKNRLVGECGVFVQHSLVDPETGDEEGLPAAIQEAMAQGMAVVSTRHAGIPDAVVDGETGLLVDEGDVAGMARAMLAAASQGFGMGLAGHRRAAARYRWADEKARLAHWLFASQAPHGR